MDIIENMMSEEVEEVKMDIETHFVPADPGNEEDPFLRSAIYVRYRYQNRVE